MSSLSPRHVTFEAERIRHHDVSISVFAVRRFVTTRTREQRAKAEQRDFVQDESRIRLHTGQPVNRGPGFSKIAVRATRH